LLKYRISAKNDKTLALLPTKHAKTVYLFFGQTQAFLKKINLFAEIYVGYAY